MAKKIKESYQVSPLRLKVRELINNHPEYTVDDVFHELYSRDNSIKIHHVQNAWRAEKKS